MSFPNQPPHSGPAGAPPNTAGSFNALPSRSRQDQMAPEPVTAAPGYGNVYGGSAPSPQPFAQNAGALGGARPPQQAQILPVDLPPQAFLTSAMLLDMVDKKVDILLRDEKEYIGILRSYDQFANLVLTECYERISARNPDAAADPTVPKWLACDVKCPGVMTIRGENVTICATVDLDREDDPKGLKFVEEETVRALGSEQKAQKAASESRKAKALKKAGIEPNLGMHV